MKKILKVEDLQEMRKQWEGYDEDDGIANFMLYSIDKAIKEIENGLINQPNREEEE